VGIRSPKAAFQWPKPLPSVGLEHFLDKSLKNAEHCLTHRQKKITHTLQGKNKGKQFSTMKVFIAPSYYDWQVRILKALNACMDTETGEVTGDWKKEILGDKAMDKDMMKKSLMFGSFVLEQFKVIGKDCLALEMPFDESDLIGKNVEKMNVSVNSEKETMPSYFG
jgi:hypothetical protein